MPDVAMLHLDYPSPDLLDQSHSPEHKQSQGQIADCGLERSMGGQQVGDYQVEND